MKKPNFFIVGAPKCGTTALANWLSEHPNIFMAKPKEPQYYSTDLKSWPIRNERQYLRLFKKASAQEYVIGEASPRYLYSNVAISHLIHDCPSAKLVVSLRNPLDMAQALHGERRTEGVEDIENFEEAWRAQRQREEGHDIPRLCPEPRLLLYGPACCLGSQLKRLYSLVPANQVHVVFLEDLQKDPKATYRGILGFLGVADDGRESFPVVNASARSRWPAVTELLKRVDLLRWKLNVPPLGTGLLSAVARTNRVAFKRPRIREGFKRELLDYFEGEIRDLESITGRNLEHWRD